MLLRVSARSVSASSSVRGGSARRLKRKVEGRTLPDRRARAHVAAMLVHDALHGRESNSGAGELTIAVQSLKWREQLVGVLHVEARAVVADDKRRRLGVRHLHKVYARLRRL